MRERERERERREEEGHMREPASDKGSARQQVYHVTVARLITSRTAKYIHR